MKDLKDKVTLELPGLDTGRAGAGAAEPPPRAARAHPGPAGLHQRQLDLLDQPDPNP